MWIMTTAGFFSIAEKPEDRAEGMLTVRARVRRDLTRLRRDYLPQLGRISRSDRTDYPFRARAQCTHVADALARIALNIDYGNFKHEVGVRQGPRRAQIYSHVWSDLLDLEQLNRKVSEVDPCLTL